MREILFRGKCVNDGEWIYGYLLESYSLKWIINPLSDGNFKWFLVDESTICQFTGLLDKNGNKIWENDIVADKRYKYSVVWDEEEGSWMLETISHARYGLAGIGRLNSEKFEVISNVFDNKELLEE